MTLEMYSIIYDCCEKYYEWQWMLWFGLSKVNTAIIFEIPTLFKNQAGNVDKPSRDYYDREDEFDQFALLDLI